MQWVNSDCDRTLSDSFRVSSASAMNVTRSINKLKVSPRLHNIQNEVKPKNTKLQDVPDPLTSYGEFRGLIIPDHKSALGKIFPTKFVNKLQRDTLEEHHIPHVKFTTSNTRYRQPKTPMLNIEESSAQMP